MKRWIWIVWLLPLLLPADMLEPNKVYEGPRKLSAPNFGASLMLPQGWEAQMHGVHGPLVLQHDTDADRILVEANVSVSGDPLAMLEEKREYYGLKLFSPMQIKRMRPSLYYRLYQVEGSDAFDQALVYLVLGSQGRAVVMFGFFEPGRYESMRQTMMRLADSLGFTPIRALPHQTGDLYMALLSGHFVFYEPRGSYSEKRELWLCRSGDAVLKGTYATANSTTRSVLRRWGKWRLQNGRLILEFTDGTAERYDVRRAGSLLLFDGAQTFRLPNHLCE